MTIQVHFEYSNLFHGHNEVSHTIVTKMVTYLGFIAQWNCVYLYKTGIVALSRVLCRFYRVLGAPVHNTYLSRLNESLKVSFLNSGICEPALVSQHWDKIFKSGFLYRVPT